MADPITLTYKDKTITLIPTAHVSKNSAEMVGEIIDQLHPDSICVELDQSRYNTLKDPQKYRNTDIIKIIKTKQVPSLLVNLILSNYQRKLAGKLDTSSGGEMMMGIKKAEETGAHLVLADRDIQVTFKRIWGNMNLKDKAELLSAIISAIFDDEELSEEDLASLQKEDMLTQAINELVKSFPNLAEPLLIERDKYLANKIKNAPGQNIVAILGAAHTIGIQDYIYQDYDIKQFEALPPKKKSSQIIKWIIPVIILIVIIASFSFDANLGKEEIKSWILCNGTMAALGALLALANPLAIITAFIASPITSLNPLLAAGWFAGLVQAYIDKPTVKDFDNLSTDLNTWTGFWKNKVTKILLLVVFANLGSSLGSVVSGLSIFKKILSLL